MSDFVIETKLLTKVYGEQTAVNNVSLHIGQGRIYGLLGRNGAGKTTIMKMILGLTPITSGEIRVFGGNIKGREKQIYPRIGAIVETPGFYPNLTGTENLEIFAKLRGTTNTNAVKNALEVVGLPFKDKKLFSKFSLGMKQRLGIANAIMHDPELLILDEPTNGLDPIGISEVRKPKPSGCLRNAYKEQAKEQPRRSHSRSMSMRPRSRSARLFSASLLRRRISALKALCYHNKRIKSPPLGRGTLITKAAFVDFLISPYYRNIARKSIVHKEQGQDCEKLFMSFLAKRGVCNG